MISFLIFLFILGILIIVHEFGHFIAAKRTKVGVEQFSLGFGPKLFSFKRQDTEYSICSIPLGGYVKLAGDNPEEFKGQPFEYLSKSPGMRAKIVFSGPLLNYVLAFLCFWLIFVLGFPTLSCRVGDLLEGLGAQEAGVLIEDKILSVDDQDVKFWLEMQRMIQRKKDGEVVRLLILRNNEKLQLPVRVKQQEIETIWGKTKTVGLIGVKPAKETVTIKYPVFKSFFLAGQRLFELSWLSLNSLVWMALGKVSFRESVTGPLGMFFITQEAAHLGFVSLLQVIGLISMSLAIFNLLPFPVLDGGHLLFLVIEKIRQRRLNSSVEKVINQIGFSLIMLLAIFVFYNDLLRYGVFEKITQWLR